jgi:toxin CcdB
MARFDVFTNEGGSGYLLDIQADLLDHLNTRLVVPLLPRDLAPAPAKRLNPLFEIEGRICIMATQFAAAIPASRLRRRVASLVKAEYQVSNALDMLLYGY